MASQPEKLFKYCSASTALQVLEEAKLRWSSPSLFKDPLELDYETTASFDADSLLQATIKLASSLIFSADNPKGDTPLINAIRRWRTEERFATPDEAHAVLNELLAKMVDQRMILVEQFIESWRTFHSQTRVCCFSSKPDSFAAWDYFGDHHAGVCFRFAATAETSAANSLPVEYKVDRPELVSITEQINAILLNQPLEQTPDFRRLLLTKPPSRKLEQEWRCFTASPSARIPENRSQWFDDISFDKAELTAVCFGFNSSEKDIAKIKKTLKDSYPKARCYQTSLATGKYELELKKLE